MAFAPAVPCSANLFALPAAVVPLPELCHVARWASTGQINTLQHEWRHFDDALDGDEAALSVLGGGRFRRAWHLHSSLTAQLWGETRERAEVLAAARLGGEMAPREIARAIRPPREERMQELTSVLSRPCAGWSEYPSNLVSSLFRFATPHPPLEVMASVLRTAFDG